MSDKSRFKYLLMYYLLKNNLKEAEWKIAKILFTLDNVSLSAPMSLLWFEAK